MYLFICVVYYTCSYIYTKLTHTKALDANWRHNTNNKYMPDIFSVGY